MVKSQLISDAWALLGDFIKECFGEEVSSYLEKEFTALLFSSFRGWTRIMLYPNPMHEMILKNSRVLRVVGGGVLAGWLWGGKFVPSPHLYNFIYDTYQKTACAVIAMPQGIKAFLYGNDLLLASLKKILPPVRKERYVAVIDSEDFRAIGIGMMLYDEDEIRKLVRQGQMLSAIVKNVFDLGMHVRNENFLFSNNAY
jgi:ribosome biogenesis protein Nip4